VIFKIKKISTRVILLVLALELTSISIWGYATYSNSRSELVKSIGSQLYQVALRVDTELKGFFEPATIHISALSDAVQGLNLSEKEMIPITNELFKSRPEIDELSIINGRGEELYRHGRLYSYTGQSKRNISSDPLFNQAMKNGRSTGPIEFSKFYEPTMRMLFRLDNRQGDSLIIETVLNLKWIWGLAQQQVIGESGIVYIVASDGKLVSYPNHSLVLAGAKINDKLPKQHFSKEENRNMQFYSNLDGKSVIGISLYDITMNWWIIVELPTQEGLLPLTRMLHWFSIIFISAVLLTSVIIIIFSKITMRPLDSIMQAISRISLGERGVKIKINTHSELATLAEGINDMMSRLDDRIDQLLESQSALLESKSRYMQLNKNLEQKIQIATQDLQETNKKLTESVKLAKEASQSKSMFLANTSHELRTPLNAILGYSELINEIAEENHDLQLADDTNKIIYSAKYLLELINNLLDLAKIEKGKLQILPEKFNLKEFLDSLVDIISPLANTNHNEFKIDFSPDIEYVTTDETRLRQIIINLVSNSFKFTKQGEVSLSVYSVTIKNIKYLHFCVSDTGIGMTPKQIERLFEVFQQADAKTTRRYGGSGLGLALSKQLALLMKGNILASSISGQGSDFTVVIPMNYYDVEDNHFEDTLNSLKSA